MENKANLEIKHESMKRIYNSSLSNYNKNNP
jgi:hypothetical protein